jgi:hypothetical protein
MRVGAECQIHLYGTQSSHMVAGSDHRDCEPLRSALLLDMLHFVIVSLVLTACPIIVRSVPNVVSYLLAIRLFLELPSEV